MMQDTNRQNAEKRLEWLDALKGILIIFVILSHSYPPQIYRYFFTPFFLTMFFWASGYTFSTKKNFKEFFLNKCKRLLIPFLVLGGMRVILAYLIEGGKLWQRIEGFLWQKSCQYDELWFVACLFSVSIIFYIVCRISYKWKGIAQDIILLLISVVCFVISMLDMCVWKIRCPWQLEIAGMMILYMAMGYLHHKHEDIIKEYWKNKKLYIVGLGILYCVISLGVHNDVDIHREVFERPLLFLLLSILIIIPILFIAREISITGFHKIFVFLGQNTLFYYAFGGSVRIVLYKICEYFSIANEYIMPVICTLFTLIVLAVPAYLVRRYAPWAIGIKKNK